MSILSENTQVVLRKNITSGSVADTLQYKKPHVHTRKVKLQACNSRGAARLL